MSACAAGAMATGTAAMVMAVISAAASFFISDFLCGGPRPTDCCADPPGWRRVHQTRCLDPRLHGGGNRHGRGPRGRGQYLFGITTHQPGMTQSVRTMIRQLLPTGTASLELIAGP